MQRQNNTSAIEHFERELTRKLAEDKLVTNGSKAQGHWNVLAAMCREHDVALTILTDRIAFLHRNADRYCLRVEFDPVGSQTGSVTFEPFELSTDLHAALNQIKETVSQQPI